MTVHDGHSGPTTPGEGHRTGTGGPDALRASEGLDAAIEAATIAIEAAADEWSASGKGDITLMEAEAEYYDLPGVRADDGEPFARVAVRAAAPILRRAVAEEIARAIEVAQGDRCPECRGRAASKKWARNPNRTVGRCGGGHTWEIKHSGGPVWFPAEIAREVGRGQ